MKYIVAGDLHGNLYYTNFLCDRINIIKPQKVILLGDIYDGNNNNDMEKALANCGVPVISVEGNCDYRHTAFSRLKFEGSYIIEVCNGRRYCFTHGHIYNKYNIPDFLSKGDVLIYGHTHVYGIGAQKDIHIINAGSVGRPRDLTKNSFVLIEDNTIEIRDVEFGDLIERVEL